MIPRAILLWTAILITIGCATPPSELKFNSVPPSSTEGPDPNRSHPPLITLEDYQRFDRAKLEVISERGAGAGVTGARRVTIRIVGHDEDLKLKMKDFPSGLDGTNNSPRKELAAYTI